MKKGDVYPAPVDPGAEYLRIVRRAEGGGVYTDFTPGYARKLLDPATWKVLTLTESPELYRAVRLAYAATACKDHWRQSGVSIALVGNFFIGVMPRRGGAPCAVKARALAAGMHPGLAGLDLDRAEEAVAASELGFLVVAWGDVVMPQQQQQLVTASEGFVAFLKGLAS